MTQSQKFMVLMLLVLFSAGMSLACGGGGSSPSGDTSLSPSDTASTSPTTTPTASPTPSPTPTDTGTPTNFLITDFGGHWKYNYNPPAKIDSAVSADFYFNVDSSGMVIPEPIELNLFPLILSGQITLDDAATGDFSATITFQNSSDSMDTEVFNFSGVMNSAKDGLNVAGTNVLPAEKMSPMEAHVGKATLDVFSALNPSSEYVFSDVEIMNTMLDGTFTLENDSISGTWQVFREIFFIGTFEYDDDGQRVGDIFILLKRMDLNRKIDAAPSPRDLIQEGFFKEKPDVADGEPDTGTINGYFLDPAAPNFSRDMLNNSWSFLMYEEPEGTSDDEELFQGSGLVIDATGLPASTRHGIISGTVDVFNTANGYFEINLILDDGTDKLKGFLSGSGDFAYMIDYIVELGQETPSGELRLFREFAGRGEDRIAGNWNISAIPQITQTYPTVSVLNLAVSDGGDHYPIRLAEQTGSYEGSVIVLGHDLFSFLITIDVPVEYGGGVVTFWSVASMPQGQMFNENAYFYASTAAGEFEDVGIVASYLGDGAAANRPDYAGTYQTNNPALGDATFVWDGGSSTMSVSFANVSILGQTPSFPVVFDEANADLLAFHIDLGTLGATLGFELPLTFYFIPMEVGFRFFVQVFSDNATTWGIKQLVP